MKKVHLIGIGGIGMSALARLLLDRGVRVSGSDAGEGSMVQDLRRLGGDVAVGHRAGNLDHPDCVVYSSAVSPANPELVAARNRGIPVFHRGQMLARLVEGRRTLAVSGSHGKSTTTAMIALAAVQAGLDPLAILGAEVDSLGGNLRPGRGIYAVVEADESDNSFLWLRPWGAVVTNVDEEHLDFFRNRWEIAEAYRTFISRIDSGGFLVACADDPGVRRLLRGEGRARWTYGFSRAAEFRAERVEADAAGSRYLCCRANRRLGPVRLRVPGRHNVLNSLAAIAAAQGMGIPFPKAAQALAAYRGARRRFQIHGEHRGVTVVEDYGHHPAEIQATLQAARAWKTGRIRCLFQPHRYSRTRHLMDRFAGCFSSADELIILPVYAASEDPLEGATSEALARRIRAPSRSRVHLQAPAEALAYLKKTALSGDLILFLGAGSVGSMAGKFLKSLSKNT